MILLELIQLLVVTTVVFLLGQVEGLIVGATGIE
jgi:hypothetical protein